TYGETINNRGNKKERLPVPTLLVDKTNLSKIIPFTEFHIVLEQRIPSGIASRMRELLDEGQSITFDFRSLEIPVQTDRDPEQRGVLPTYSLSFHKIERIIFSSRVVYVGAHIRL